MLHILWQPMKKTKKEAEDKGEKDSVYKRHGPEGSGTGLGRSIQR